MYTAFPFATLFDPHSVRRQFPLLARDERLAYLDTAASAQKPEAVLKEMDAFLRTEYANVHRGLFSLAERATAAYEGAREAVRDYLSARYADEIVFTRGTTEAINLVAISLSRGGFFQEGDLPDRQAGAVILTRLDHHANQIPWLQLRERKGIEIRWLDIDDEGMLRMDEYEKLLADGCVKLVAVTGQSNVLGVRPDLRKMADMAHAAGAVILADGAQLAAHERPDVVAMMCDFFAFSGHKVYGPTGIGVLYGKRELLCDMPPFLGGGMMLKDVTDDGFVPADPPMRFEAGTPPIVEATGLATALRWLSYLQVHDAREHEKAMLTRLLEGLKNLKGVRVLGPGDVERISGCVSFVVDGVHAHDVAEVLGKEGVCIRAGHHCAQPLHKRLGVLASARISVAVHTTSDDIDRAVAAIEKAKKLFA